LDELEKLLSRKLESTVKTINQFVSDAIEDVEKDLKHQIETLRRQLGAAVAHSEIQPEAQPKTQSKTQPKKQPKKQSKAQQKPQLPQLQLELPFPPPKEDYETLSLRRLKAIGKDRKIRGYARMKRPEILAALREADGK
jgi:hypothetical protein